MKSILIAVAAACLPGLAAAQHAPPSAPAAKPAAPGQKLTIDSSFFDLVENPRTAAVLKKRMPGFVERFIEDEQLQQMFGAISIRGLSIDQDHARGFTPEVLAKLDAELAAAQAAPTP